MVSFEFLNKTIEYVEKINKNVDRYNPSEATARAIKTKIIKQLQMLKELESEIKKKYIFKTI